MTPEFQLRHVLPGALALLPAGMDTPEARVLLLAIGLQESRFGARLQHGGPARGYWQFERSGVAGVLTHPSSRGHAEDLCAQLGYSPGISVLHASLADNDFLACAFARLLLWTLPGVLPTLGEDAWQAYLTAWRPGRPRPETWPGHFADARRLVGA